MNAERELSVSAIIVTWNSSRDIHKCIESLLQQSHPVDEIIVVDNNSSDQTIDIIRDNFPSVQIIALNDNVGFARANNIALEKVKNEWVLFLNPDAWLDNGFLYELFKFHSGNQNARTLGGLILKADDVKTVDSYGISIYKSRRVVDSGMGAPLSNAPKEPIRVFGICAASMLIAKKVLDDVIINGEVFPERFFCYYEDADLCWRIWRRNWEAWTIPSAIAFHRRGGADVGSSFSRFLTHRNRWWLIGRNESYAKILISGGIAFWLHEVLMLLRMLRYPSLFLASWQGLKGVFQSIRERKELKLRNKKEPPLQCGTGFWSNK